MATSPSKADERSVARGQHLFKKAKELQVGLYEALLPASRRCVGAALVFHPACSLGTSLVPASITHATALLGRLLGTSGYSLELVVTFI